MRILPLRNSFMFSMDDLYRVFFYYQTIFSLLFRVRKKSEGGDDAEKIQVVDTQSIDAPKKSGDELM